MGKTLVVLSAVYRGILALMVLVGGVFFLIAAITGIGYLTGYLDGYWIFISISSTITGLLFSGAAKVGGWESKK